MFSPRAIIERIQIVWEIVAQFMWNVYHLDVKLVFLNGDLDETFMSYN